jgi:hypothetical protein
MRVAAPAFSLPSGFYHETIQVSITCPTPGAIIHYTLDGSNPTQPNPGTQETPSTWRKQPPYAPKPSWMGILTGPITGSTYLINERQPSLPVVMLTLEYHLFIRLTHWHLYRGGLTAFQEQEAPSSQLQPGLDQTRSF